MVPSTKAVLFSSRRGFTLIELLVVISIITLLIGILLPALAMARRAARTTLSTSNVRSIAQATYMYANDFKYSYPSSGHTGVNWMEQLGLPAVMVLGTAGDGLGDSVSFHGDSAAFNAYITRVNSCGKYVEDPRAFISPNDASPFITKGNATGKRRWTSYGFNAYFAYDHPPYFGEKLDSVKSPSGTITHAEYRDEDANATDPWEDHFVAAFANNDATQTFSVGTMFLSGFSGPGRSGYANVQNPNINISAYPFPSELNTLYGGAIGATVDYSDDAKAAWDSTKMQFNSTFDEKRYNGMWLYGFADGHAGMMDPKSALQWSNTSAAPTVNRFDPESVH